VLLAEKISIEKLSFDYFSFLFRRANNLSHDTEIIHYVSILYSFVWSNFVDSNRFSACHAVGARLASESRARRRASRCGRLNDPAFGNNLMVHSSLFLCFVSCLNDGSNRVCFICTPKFWCARCRRLRNSLSLHKCDKVNDPQKVRCSSLLLSVSLCNRRFLFVLLCV
jgi:hypothetical protein